jgi:ABC-type transport system involved in multi-copper enzyme maturation permease subunit
VTAPTVPGPGPASAGDAGLRPIPWRRTAWVSWRQHRFALGGVAVLLGALSLYLWLAGLHVHHTYATVAACHPATSYACQNQVINFNSAYGSTARTVAILLQTVPALIGAFLGAPVLARELETGTFRYAWTLGVGRQQWTLAKLVPLAIAVAAAAGAFSLLFSWYYQPFFADGNNIPLDPTLFGLRGVAFAAWTLAGFAIGALAGLLIRRVVPAIAATLAVYAGLLFAARLYLQQHYLTPLTGRNLFNPPAGAWLISSWWTKGGTTISRSAMGQLTDTMLRQIMPALLPKNVNDNDVKFYKGAANSQVLHYFTQHGYIQWTSYQPGSRFWPFQWIEGGWLLVLAVLLIAATVWLVGRRAT